MVSMIISTTSNLQGLILKSIRKLFEEALKSTRKLFEEVLTDCHDTVCTPHTAGGVQAYLPTTIVNLKSAAKHTLRSHGSFTPPLPSQYHTLNPSYRSASALLRPMPAIGGWLMSKVHTKLVRSTIEGNNSLAYLKAELY